jgi:hypothetical protein
MCRSIKTLRDNQPPATEEEVQAAALQYVRKISGYRKPSRRNQVAFDQAVAEVAAATQKLLAGLEASKSGYPVQLDAD